MKFKFLLLFLTTSNIINAQWRENFDIIPITGKINSYTIYQVFGDSLNSSTRDIEQVFFDSTGQILSAKYYDMESDGLRKQVKSIVNDEETISYECHCSDIDKFIAEFKFRDIAELENKPKTYTHKAPTDWVSVKSFDNRGNLILLKTYSSSGYLIREVESTFDLQNKLVSKVVFEFKHKLSYSENNTYDKNNNWENWIKHTAYINVAKNVRTTHVDVTKYKLKIEYW